jgi:hypothetical protein
MSTFITFAIILFGLAIIGGATYYKVKTEGRHILPWTKEAKHIRALRKEEEFQKSIRRYTQHQKDDWDDQFGR